MPTSGLTLDIVKPAVIDPGAKLPVAVVSIEPGRRPIRPSGSKVLDSQILKLYVPLTFSSRGCKLTKLSDLSRHIAAIS